MSNRRIPIDVFTKRQQTLIAESLREVSRALSFSDVVRNYIERVMGRRELGDLLGEVCIVAGDESIQRRRHDLVTTRGNQFSGLIPLLAATLSAVSAPARKSLVLPTHLLSN